MKGKLTMTLPREQVKEIINQAVRDLLLAREIEITGFEVHRSGAVTVEFKEAASLPIADAPSLEP